MRVGGGVVGDPGYRTADAANGDERRPLRCPDLGQDLQDLGHRFLVDKGASGDELDARRRGHAVHERVRIGLQRDIVADHRAEPADRVDRLGRELRVVAVKGDVDLDRRFGSAGERIGEVRDGCELFGSGAQVVRPALEHGGRLRCREGDLAVEDVCRRVRRELEGGHDPEIAAATADRPEQLRVLLRARTHDLSAGGDHLRGDHVVQGQTVLPDLPADAAGQRQPTDTDALGVARGDRQAMRGQGGRDLTPGGAAADPHEVTFVVDDLHVRELAEVDHDAAVVGAEARKAMAAASHGQRKPRGGGESDTCLHVPDALGPQHIGRTTRGQYRATGRFVLRSARFDDVAAEVTAKGFKR